jgi:hypothetical protein
MPKVIDCFTFYNEFKLLDLRLKELDQIVDQFVLVEATKTFTGQDKRLFFDEVKDRYNKARIIHVVVDDMPSDTDAWGRERHQRNCISRGLDRISLKDDDIVVLTDVDEIPDSLALELVSKACIDDCLVLEMDFYYYNLNCKWEDKWMHPKVSNYGKCKEMGDFETMRRWPCSMAIPHGGWHFSYFGDIDFIRNKIQSFSHQEYNTEEYTSPEKIKKCIDEGISLFGENRSTHVDPDENNYLPKNWRLLA